MRKPSTKINLSQNIANIFYTLKKKISSIEPLNILSTHWKKQRFDPTLLTYFTLHVPPFGSLGFRDIVSYKKSLQYDYLERLCKHFEHSLY